MVCITAKSTFTRSDDIVSREIEGELLIIPIASGIGDMEDELFTLNDTGKDIWNRLDGNRTLGDIASDLAQKYSAPPDVVIRDVIGLAGELAKRKIIIIKG
jgi:hypothetical protein